MVTGPTIAEEWNNLYCLERAAEVQVREMSTGRQLRSVSPGFAKRVVAEMREGDPESVRLHLASIEQILTREDPAFAT